MKKEQQVCTLEQAKILKELGIKSDGLLFWSNPNEGENFNLVLRHEFESLMGDVVVDSMKEKSNYQQGEWFTYDKEEVKSYVEQTISGLINDNQTDCLLTAFTVAELGIMLPSETLTIRRGSEDSEYSNWEWENEGDGKAWGVFNTEAEARADHLIMLLQNAIITPEEVNNRLTTTH